MKKRTEDYLKRKLKKAPLELTNEEYEQLNDEEKDAWLDTVITCPLCGKNTTIGFSATCRRDNKTCICPECGLKQGLSDMQRILGIEMNV